MSRDVLDRFPTCRYLLYKTVFAVFPWLPLQVSRFIAWTGGHIAWSVDRRGRRVVADNVRHFCRQRDRDLRGVVRRSYCRFFLAMVEGLHLRRFPRREVTGNRFRLTDPWGHLRELPLRGPQIFSTMHCCWELFPPISRAHGIAERFHIIALSHEDPRIDEIFQRERSRLGVDSLLLDQAPLAALRALREGALLGIVSDRDYTRHGLPVRIAGRPTSIPIGAAAMAVQTGIPVVPILLARNGWTKFWMLLGPPLRAPAGASKRQQIEIITAGLADWFERCLLAVPEQWVAFHPFWQDQQQD